MLLEGLKITRSEVPLVAQADQDIRQFLAQLSTFDGDACTLNGLLEGILAVLHRAVTFAGGCACLYCCLCGLGEYENQVVFMLFILPYAMHLTPPYTPASLSVEEQSAAACSAIFLHYFSPAMRRPLSPQLLEEAVKAVCCQGLG